MTALLVVLLVVTFLVIDMGVRAVSRRMTEAEQRRAREAALRTSVRLTFASEAKSLKRAEVPSPRARILAVDDEPVILDVFRKILVLAGYSVDTVESGPEALTLVRARDYDFVFTDLKMPEMDGAEVVKAVKHLRPDVDVAVITGFGTIESAVATLQYGALDYVQKPFTEDELVAFANRLTLRRQDRLDAQRRPTVRVVSPALAETIAGRDYCVPGGAFVSAGHVWARIDPGGQVWAGLDDFARKALRRVERIDLPAVGAWVERGGLLFVVRRGHEMARFLAPLSGEITQLNPELAREPRALIESPYDRGWVCRLRPLDLASELSGLRIGKPVIAWYQEEVARLRRETRDAEDGVCPWPILQSRFLGPGLAKSEPLTEIAAGA
jgi:CheY-like chemotaxis protein